VLLVDSLEPWMVALRVYLLVALTVSQWAALWDDQMA
jgi:hypothetical protein